MKAPVAKTATGAFCIFFIQQMQYTCTVFGMSADIPPRVTHKEDCMQLKINHAIAAWDDANR
jgi:hypothetical protein